MNKIARFIFAVWIVIGGCAGAPEPCLADQLVVLKTATEVRSSTVKLSDIFEGIPPDADRDIAQSPPPGKQVSYDVAVLTRVAKKYDLDWKPQSIADHVVITTSCSRITSDMIKDAVTAKIQARAASKFNGSVDVTFDNRALEIDLPMDHVPDYAIANFDFDSQSKRFHGDIVADTPAGPVSVPVTGRATFKRLIPVLAKRLEGGTVIGASDITEIEVNEEHIKATMITDSSQLIGREVRRDTDGGEVLLAQDVIAPRFVTRGSLVTLRIETPFMLLTAQGKALQDGAQGDVVRVTNTQSNRLVEGTVEGPGLVRIKTAQHLAEAQ
ncbi:MAG: flagellar basal body P-ring formation chaperone FlgA [Pseudomonadota bacterium]|nr:flagellar basal body P-ring formation chaperone FlgA [Pseudomonadota bacterium]